MVNKLCGIEFSKREAGEVASFPFFLFARLLVFGGGGGDGGGAGLMYSLLCGVFLDGLLFGVVLMRLRLTFVFFDRFRPVFVVVFSLLWLP
jgi:hypothetical protein